MSRGILPDLNDLSDSTIALTPISCLGHWATLYAVVAWLLIQIGVLRLMTFWI